MMPGPNSPPIPNRPSSASTRMIDHRFEVVTELGRGGMGVVYEVIDSLTGERRALKELNRPSNKAMGRFFDEARTQREMDHPNIVKVYRFADPDEGEPYLVTELMQGGSLEGLLKEAIKNKWAAKLQQRGEVAAKSQLPQRLVLDLVHQCAEGLTLVHAQNVAHRDLKPGNLLLSHKPHEILNGAAVQVKLSDFGIAARAPGDGGDHTEAGGFVGTLDHSPPEHLRHIDSYRLAATQNRPIEWDRPMEQVQKGDIFALGLIFYRLVTGERLWSPPSERVLESQALSLLEDGIKRFERQFDRSDQDAAQVLLRQMLSRKPEDRPNAQEVAATLGQLLRPDSVPDSPPTFEESREEQPLPPMLAPTGKHRPVQRPFSRPQRSSSRGIFRKQLVWGVAIFGLAVGLGFGLRSITGSMTSETVDEGVDKVEVREPAREAAGAGAASQSMPSSAPTQPGQSPASTGSAPPGTLPGDTAPGASGGAGGIAPSGAAPAASDSLQARPPSDAADPTLNIERGNETGEGASSGDRQESGRNDAAGASAARQGLASNKTPIGNPPTLLNSPQLPTDAAFEAQKGQLVLPVAGAKVLNRTKGDLLFVEQVSAKRAEIRRPTKAMLLKRWAPSRHPDGGETEACIDLQFSAHYWSRLCGATDSVGPGAILDQTKLLSHVDNFGRVTLRLMRATRLDGSGKPLDNEILPVYEWLKK